MITEAVTATAPSSSTRTASASSTSSTPATRSPAANPQAEGRRGLPLFFDSDMQKSLKATNRNYINSPTASRAPRLTSRPARWACPPPTKGHHGRLEAGQGRPAGHFRPCDMPRNLDQGPFYAIMVTPGRPPHVGGIEIDSKTGSTTKGQVIPGFFAAR